MIGVSLSFSTFVFDFNYSAQGLVKRKKVGESGQWICSRSNASCNLWPAIAVPLKLIYTQ